MSQLELLKRVSATLEALGVPYMVTGSFASSAQGQPRSTHDIDLVVALLPSVGKKLLQTFAAPDFYADDVAMIDAIRHGGMFNLLDLRTGDKVDFWTLTDEEFDRVRFGRRQRHTLADTAIWMSSPEDTILMKLRWAMLSGGSEKQFADALRIWEVQGSSLDRSYIETWVKKLGVSEHWQRLLREASSSNGP